jgi:hypothetical protein
VEDVHRVAQGRKLRLGDGLEARVARGGADGVRDQLVGQARARRLDRADAAAQFAVRGLDRDEAGRGTREQGGRLTRYNFVSPQRTILADERLDGAARERGQTRRGIACGVVACGVV